MLESKHFRLSTQTTPIDVNFLTRQSRSDNYYSNKNFRKKKNVMKRNGDTDFGTAFLCCRHLWFDVISAFVETDVISVLHFSIDAIIR